jgi:hypothetical protein
MNTTNEINKTQGLQVSYPLTTQGVVVTSPKCKCFTCTLIVIITVESIQILKFFSNLIQIQNSEQYLNFNSNSVVI